MDRQKILIVEDNPVLCEGLKEMLSFEGFSAFTAANGLEALRLMETAMADLILSDIMMPEMDGFAFFNAVRARPDWVTVPFIFLSALGDADSILAAKNLGVEDYLTKPVSREELVTAVRARLDRSRQIQVAQLQQAYEAGLTALADAIDLRERYASGHVERVSAYALTLAGELGWPEWRLQQLQFGAILHDIGKIHIRETTLFKSTPLTIEEWFEIKQHPETGAEMIKDIGYLAPAVPIVRCHHERWDGQGYPEGLAREAIPIGARIVAVADSLDAMTTRHSYRPALTFPQAFAEIQESAGSQFDPDVVNALEKAWEAGRIRAIADRWQHIFHSQ